MERRAFLAAAAAAGTPIVAGCGGGGDGEPPMEATVRIAPAGNQPREVRVAVGGTVTWVNADSAVVNAHTVTSATFHETATDWEFDEQLPEEGDQVSHTFDSAGVYEYYDREEGRECRCGVVLVGDVDAPGALPCVGTSPGSC
jgi:plastocyanin